MKPKQERTYDECVGCGTEEIEIVADGLCADCFRKRKKKERAAAHDKEHAVAHKEKLIDPRSETRRLRHQLLQHFQGLLAVLAELGDLVGSMADSDDPEPPTPTAKFKKSDKREEKEEIAETGDEDESEDEIEED